MILVLSIFNLEVLQARRYKELSNKNSIRLLSQGGARGRILDCKGDIIVDNSLVYDVTILPQASDQIDKALMSVAKILELSMQDLKVAFRNGYVASFIPVTIAKNVDIKKAIALEEIKMDFPGIIIQPRPARSYPYGKLASHVIGYLNEIDRWRLTKLADYGYKTKDIVGYTGIEEKYDYYLRQEDGALSVEVDHMGRFVRVLGFKPPKNGKDIQLTLDLKIQKIAEDNLEGKKGSVIIMNPFSGEIIAMASSPSFEPSIFIKQSRPSISSLFDNPDSALINKAMQAAYPPGSVFKLVVAAAALEAKKINVETTFFCPGYLKIGNRKFNCWETHNQQDLIAAITHSCDVFFYRTGLLLGGSVIHDYAVKFGFSKLTNFELPYEVSGFVPDPLWKRIQRFQNWFDGDTANFSIGQGDLLVTPLQTVRMMAVFANRGFLINPYIVKSVGGQDISISQRRATRIHLKEKTLEYIRQGIRRAVSDPTGTASILSNPEVAIAGKTGTSQVSRGSPHGWFAGFFPFKNPRFVICVFLEHGGSGQAACILTKQIIEAMIQEGLIE